MARPRKPTKVLEVTGVMKQRPGRYADRNAEPVPESAIGEWPEKLSTNPAEVWAELVASACPGVLTGSDRVALEIATRLLCEFRMAGTVNDAGKVCPRMDSKDISQLRALLSQFGMTPADRSKLKIDPPKKPAASPYAKFARK